MAMGVELGMELGGYHNASNATGAGTPMSHHVGNYSAAAHHFYGMQPMGDANMRVDELLDLSCAGAHDFFAAAADNGNHQLCAGVGEPSATTPSATSSDHQTSMLSFADEFYIPVSRHHIIINILVIARPLTYAIMHTCIIVIQLLGLSM